MAIGRRGRAAAAGDQLVVLHSFRTLSSSSNPYLAQLVSSLPATVNSRTFSWLFALTGRYDVLHVQWPELLVRGRDRGRTAVRLTLFATLLAVLRLRGVAVVRTVHNVEPHDAGGGAERVVLQRLSKITTVWVRLNVDTVLPGPAPHRTIAHGHYRDWFAGHHVPAAVPGRVLYFGLVRRYKGVEALVDAFAELTDPSATLRIVGKPDPAALGQRIAAAVDIDARASAQLAYVPDDQLAREIGQAQLVVLPYSEIHNSGSVLLALSLDRPVLVPAGPTTLALQQEVGSEWVLLFPLPLTAAVLGDALDRTRRTGSGDGPDLSARDWPAIGEQFAAVYREAAALAGRRRYSA